MCPSLDIGHVVQSSDRQNIPGWVGVEENSNRLMLFCCEALPVKEAENLVQEESKPVPNLELLLLQQKCCFQLRSWGFTFNPNERGAHVAQGATLGGRSAF